MNINEYYRFGDNLTAQVSLDEEKAKLVGTVRALRHAIRHPEDEHYEQKIAVYKEFLRDLFFSVHTVIDFYNYKSELTCDSEYMKTAFNAFVTQLKDIYKNIIQ